MTERELKQIVFSEPKMRDLLLRTMLPPAWGEHDPQSKVIGFIVITPNLINYQKMLPLYDCEHRSFIRRWLNENHRLRPNMGDSNALVCLAEIQ